MVSQKFLTELEQIVKEDYGVSLSSQELQQLGNLLIDSYDILTSKSTESREEDQE